MKRVNTTAISLQKSNHVTHATHVQEEGLASFIQVQKFNYTNKNVRSILTKEQGEKYIAVLESKTSFDDLVDLFKGNNPEQLFGKSTNKMLLNILRDILHINDNHSSSSKQFFERKLSLFRNILKTSVEEQDSYLGNAVINTLINGNSSEDLSLTERRRLHIELKEIFDGSNDSSDGCSAMNLMGDLLASPFSNTLIFAMDLFSSEDLVRNVFSRAYEEDYDFAYESVREIFHFLETRDMPNIHSSQIVRYGELINRIKEINLEAISSRRSYRANPKIEQPKPITVEVISIKNNLLSHAPSQVQESKSTDLIISGTLNNLVKFLEEPEIKNPEIGINASKYLPSNRDIVNGLSMILEALPESSPLKHKLEDFLINMPTYVDKIQPDSIKSELIGLLSPIFPDRSFDMVNILGTEYPSLKKAYSTIKNKLDKILSWQDRLKLPKLEYLFDDYDAVTRGVDIESQYTRITLDMYKKGEKSLVDIANIFCERYSRDSIPLHQYVKKFIDYYKQVIKQVDPKFDINLESTHFYIGKIKSFVRFLGEISLQEPDLRHASSLLSSACDKYLKLKLNDQTFLDEVVRLQKYCMESHGPGPKIARDISYLINAFMQVNHH